PARRSPCAWADRPIPLPYTRRRDPDEEAVDMGLSSLSLEGLRALVTGAGTGLGLQFAEGLAEAGADLVICGRRRAPLDSAADTLRALGADVQVIQADVTREPDLARLQAEAGRVDILVNNAGGGEIKPWRAVSRGDWDRLMDVNLWAPFRLIQLFAPPMIERGWGRIVNVSSINGLGAGDPNVFPTFEW